MPDTSSFKYQEMNGHYVLKKSTTIKGVAIFVILFCAFLIVNDVILCRYLNKSRIPEIRHEEKMTTPG